MGMNALCVLLLALLLAAQVRIKYAIYERLVATL
jgi:hypothetical protein